jgi:hypothetical protein
MGAQPGEAIDRDCRGRFDAGGPLIRQCVVAILTM